MADQDQRILDALSRWAAVPGRQVYISRGLDEWIVTLGSRTRVKGETLSDALAQAATIAATEVA